MPSKIIHYKLPKKEEYKYISRNKIKTVKTEIDIL